MPRDRKHRILERYLVGNKRNKYNAAKTVVDGITFHSKKEAVRYCELLIMERAREIEDITIQPGFDLTIMGVKIGKYILDFSYFKFSTGRFVYEDVKAWDKKAKKGKGDWLVTSLAKWKKKHVEIEYKIKVNYV